MRVCSAMVIEYDTAIKSRLRKEDIEEAPQDTVSNSASSCLKRPMSRESGMQLEEVISKTESKSCRIFLSNLKTEKLRFRCLGICTMNRETRNNSIEARCCCQVAT